MYFARFQVSDLNVGVQVFWSQIYQTDPLYPRPYKKGNKALQFYSNVYLAEKRTKCSSNILLCLVRFSAGQTLCIANFVASLLT